MPAVSDASGMLYEQAWIALLFIFGSYVVAAIVLRWRPRGMVGVTRYEPPKEISPAVASFLVENGRYERSFAVALISLAVKGYIGILQAADLFTLEKLREADTLLSAEEHEVLLIVFPSAIPTYAFDTRECSRLFDAYWRFQEAMDGITVPELISTRFGFWLFGLLSSFVAIAPVVFSLLPGLVSNSSPLSIAYLGFWIAIGGSCFVAALRAWPVTLQKLASLVKWGELPKRPLDVNDAIPIVLTGSATMGFMFLGVLTTPKFAELLAGVITLSVLSRHLLDAPTRAGRKVLAELRGFREFLRRADADRLDRENHPGKTPDMLEPYTAYAVALGVEHGWGQEFVGNLFELLQLEQAYGRSGFFPKANNRSTVLKLFDSER